MIASSELDTKQKRGLKTLSKRSEAPFLSNFHLPFSLNTTHSTVRRLNFLPLFVRRNLTPIASVLVLMTTAFHALSLKRRTPRDKSSETYQQVESALADNLYLSVI